ncbi:Phosphomevalonate kinase [Basidiobolus meristosporus CBS 931.73]|uniref:Phosphomevalonate kinase n=1 Tax=Basidiobolus meristosporus CBS 931.73 TaxID=1314790 RepID=A0A1Y1YMM2_9FUNG|nr:Phosphomevalonate kinase [Basidiobolus meristosporus CBS 931.73]|eukprot:ORX99251.1 Phosphomevalonate kinase [Basidiobolus meristosporus CBS 931.73]
MDTKQTVVSAPGKVLVAGGYLVLDSDNEGVVVSTDARFYTVIKNKGAATEFLDAGRDIVIRSPQFLDGRWEYSFKEQQGANWQLEACSQENRNPYVESTLRYTLGLISRMTSREDFDKSLQGGLEITIVGSNDFYSQREELRLRSLPLTSEALRSLPPFCSTHTLIRNVHKTGLGSSAALITSLVAALLVHFRVVDLKNDDSQQSNRQLVHNIAQFCHCYAQGKVGSGFDVSSAVWGTHVYRRFSSAILEEAMSDENPLDLSRLLEVVDPKQHRWDNEVHRLELPTNFILMLADIDAGSNTPSMVGKVLKWRKANPEEASRKWAQLGSLNSAVHQLIRQLAQQQLAHPDAYHKITATCSTRKASEWNTVGAEDEVSNGILSQLCTLTSTFNSIRQHLRELSDLCGVPIEPESQTRLLDACMEVPGVVMAGVPGAGGFDAIFCIALSDSVQSEVFRVWQDWKEMSVSPLLTEKSTLGVNVEEHVEGLEDAIKAASLARL